MPYVVHNFESGDILYAEQLNEMDAQIALNEQNINAGVSPDMLAEEYSVNKTYSIGDYVIHNDALYVCIYKITVPEGWNSAHWQVANLGDGISNLNKVIDEELTDVKNAVSELDGGTTDQVLCKRSNTDYDFKWSNASQPTDAQVAAAVFGWLDDHPEATTTVEDGSLTEAKFSDYLKLQTIKDYVTPQMFGAVADGQTDDTTAVQSAIDAAYNGNGAILFPKGTYLVTSGLVAYDRSIFKMDSQAVIKAGANINTILSISTRGYGMQRPEFQNISIDGNHLAVNGVIIDSFSLAGTIAVQGLSVKGCTGHGIKLNNCQGGIFIGLQSRENGGDGIRIKGCNNARFFGLSAAGNDGNGLVFGQSESDASSGACFVYGAYSEANDGYGIYFETATGMCTISGGWVEGNGLTPIKVVSNAACLIEGLRITWNVATSYAEIESDLVTIRDCQIQGGSGTIYNPALNNSKSVINNILTATTRTFVQNGREVDEKLLYNVIDGGDMQGSSGFNLYYCTYDYQNTDIVDAGKTYSIKCVTNRAAFMIRKDGTTGLTIGGLYKITFRVYYVGTQNVIMRFFVTDQEHNKTIYYAEPSPLVPGTWNELSAYYYATTAEEVRIGLDTPVNTPETGDIFYLSELLCQPCIPGRVAISQVGDMYVWENIMPTIMQ